MGLNLKTLEQEIAAVKDFGEKVFIPITIDCDNYTCTNDLVYPITDAPGNALYTELKQTLAGLHERKKNRQNGLVRLKIASQITITLTVSLSISK